MAKSKKIVVKAYIPPLQSAIMVDGTGDTMQIKLAIPLKASPDGLMLQTMTQKRMLVTFEELPNEPTNPPMNKKKWTMYQKDK